MYRQGEDLEFIVAQRRSQRSQVRGYWCRRGGGWGGEDLIGEQYGL